MKINNMSLSDINQRLAEMPSDVRNMSIEELEKHSQEINQLEERRANIKNDVEKRKAILKRVNEAGPNDPEVRILASTENVRHMGGNTMEHEKRNQETQTDLEIRSLNKYINRIDLTQEERSALTLTSDGASAVIPTTIYENLISNGKYSDILSRSTVVQGAHQGNLKIPIMSNNVGVVVKEDEEMTVANGDLTALTLKGYLVGRLMTVSSVTSAMATSQFEQMIMNLIGEELIEGIERLYVKGTGVDEPTGLDTLDLTDKTVTATTEIKPVDVAEALATLPNKYGRKAVIMGNSKTIYNLSLGVSETDQTLATGSNTFLGKEVVVNNHVDENVIYVIDLSQVYTRFSSPIALERDTSSSFRKNLIDLKATAIFDFGINTEAVAKVVVA